MMTRIALAAAVGLLPRLALAHPSGHDGLTLSGLGSHMAADAFHLLTLGGVIGAGLLTVAAAAIVRSVKARRR